MGTVKQRSIKVIENDHISFFRFNSHISTKYSRNFNVQ